MDLTFSADDLAFRDEVRAWVAQAMPAHLRRKAEVDGHFEMPEVMEWHRILYEKGWVAPHWPAAFGGSGLSATHRFIFMDELTMAGAPPLSPFGLMMVGPLIMRFGNDAQRERFLPKILSGDEVWCQGYSEPNAGSDLASVRCRAEDKGDHFLVNGQKTWTTYAQFADWIFCLVRTNTTVKKQAGISFLLIDMKSKGLEVKPMLTLGGTPAFCDTFFDQVEVPKENLVGPLDGGWNLAKALLGHERTLVGGVSQVRRTLQRIKCIALETYRGDVPLIEDPLIRERVARLELRLRAHQMTNYRALAEQQAGKSPGPETSILKLVGSTLQQEADELCLTIMGRNSLSWLSAPGIVPDLEQWAAPAYCYNRATTIYAGSNEIQKNIIAKYILGMPKG